MVEGIHAPDIRHENLDREGKLVLPILSIREACISTPLYETLVGYLCAAFKTCEHEMHVFYTELARNGASFLQANIGWVVSSLQR